MAGKSRSGWAAVWHEWIKPLVAVVLVLGTFRSAVADWYVVPSGSMKPTILEGDRIFVNKLAYDVKVPFTGWSLVHRGDPQRGDVIVFPSPADGVRLVKRVVGLPGDEVLVRDDEVWINGVRAEYEPLSPEVVRQLAAPERNGHELAAERIGGRAHPVMTTPGSEAPRFFGPVVVPPGHYLVMGDNRDNSLDSRYFGFVARPTVEGRAVGVVASLDQHGLFAPRWHRFFRPMD